jgi:hypothetical protein
VTFLSLLLLQNKIKTEQSLINLFLYPPNYSILISLLVIPKKNKTSDYISSRSTYQSALIVSLFISISFCRALLLLDLVIASAELSFPLI